MWKEIEAKEWWSLAYTEPDLLLYKHESKVGPKVKGEEHILAKLVTVWGKEGHPYLKVELVEGRIAYFKWEVK